MKCLRPVVLAALVLPANFGTAHAQGKAAIAREAAEYVMRKFSKESAEIGMDALTRKIESLAIKHGDDAFAAVRKVGPKALRITEEAGEHGLESVKLMARYGEDAVWIVAKKNRLAIFAKYGDGAAESMMKHGEIAEPLIASHGSSAANALKAVSSQNARRLAMLADDGDLAKIGRTSELLEVVARYGDQAADFIWRNKGALAITAAATAFLRDPKPFLDGAVDIATIAADNAVKPIVTEAARYIVQVILVLMVIIKWKKLGRRRVIHEE